MAIGYKLTTKAYYSLYAQGKYRLRYLPGTTVTADPTTLGIMMFPHLSDAMEFLVRCNKLKQNTVLLEIEYGDCEQTYHIAANYSEAYLDNYYNRYTFVPYIPTDFPVTIVRRSIKVLRKIAFPQEISRI